MPQTLFDLAEGIRNCTACPLWKNRELAIPGEGSSKAKIMFIGEAPGTEEDRHGLPFVGRSGKYLVEMLTLANLHPEDVFTTSCVKCHPPKNRQPTSKELSTCKELWLVKQIELINPEIIVLLGKVALKSLLGDKDLQKLHGKIVTKDGRKYFVTYHPSAGMRFPNIGLLMKKDFMKLSLLINSFPL